ncbi:FecR domain-containing protein [Reichenbachiella sp. MALMAid0571]|uniref:FecR family protein n=1 Tax=Reichenbachiella sp. MALMAid0571 TaxID=3143939 RepID=UPI0032E035B6
MKDKGNYKLHLIHNPEFKNWVQNPTDESNYYWEKWLEQNPDEQEAVNKSKEFILRLRFKEGVLSGDDTNMIFKSIISKQRPTPFFKKPLFKLNIWRYAAVLTLALCVSMIFWQYSNNEAETIAVAETVVYINKTNPKGQRSVISLKDGTKVHLNSNSTLTYSSEFGVSDRKIELKGEAYFAVAKDESKPFIVTSGNVSTTALGTEFNVDARNTDNLKIILVEGKVKVQDKSSDNTPLVLMPNQMVEYRVEDGLGSVAELRTTNDLLWIHGVLKFEDTPFSKVIDELENWYGVKINVHGDSKGLHYSGEFEDESLTNILESMSFSLGLEYSRSNEYVQLKLKK